MTSVSPFDTAKVFVLFPFFRVLFIFLYPGSCPVQFAYAKRTPIPDTLTECGVSKDGSIVWEDLKHDISSYLWLSEPTHAARRCKGLDPVWGYCAFIGGDLLSAPSLVDEKTIVISKGGGYEEQQDDSSADPDNPEYSRNGGECPLGRLTSMIFTKLFLLADERYSSLFAMWTLLMREDVAHYDLHGSSSSRSRSIESLSGTSNLNPKLAKLTPAIRDLPFGLLRVRAWRNLLEEGYLRTGEKGWPVFAALARLQDNIRVQEDFVSACDAADTDGGKRSDLLTQLMRFSLDRDGGRSIPRIVKEIIVDAVRDLEADLNSKKQKSKKRKCPLAFATAAAAMAWVAGGKFAETQDLAMVEKLTGLLDAVHAAMLVFVRDELGEDDGNDISTEETTARQLLAEIGILLAKDDGGNDSGVEKSPVVTSTSLQKALQSLKTKESQDLWDKLISMSEGGDEEGKDARFSFTPEHASLFRARLRLVDAAQLLVMSWRTPLYMAYDVLASKWPLFQMLQRFGTEFPIVGGGKKAVTPMSAISLTNAVHSSRFFSGIIIDNLNRRSQGHVGSNIDIKDLHRHPAKVHELWKRRKFDLKSEDLLLQTIREVLLSKFGSSSASSGGGGKNKKSGTSDSIDDTYYKHDLDVVPLLKASGAATDANTVSVSDSDDLRNYRLLSFAMNHGFCYSDSAVVDFAVEIVYTDLRESLRRNFGITPVHQPTDALFCHRCRDVSIDNDGSIDLNFIYYTGDEGLVRQLEVGGNGANAQVVEIDVHGKTTDGEILSLSDSSESESDGETEIDRPSEEEEGEFEDENLTEERGNEETSDDFPDNNSDVDPYSDFYKRKGGNVRRAPHGRKTGSHTGSAVAVKTAYGGRAKPKREPKKIAGGITGYDSSGRNVVERKKGAETSDGRKSESRKTEVKKKVVRKKKKKQLAEAPAGSVTIPASDSTTPSTSVTKSRAYRDYQPFDSGWRLSSTTSELTISHLSLGALTEKDSQCKLYRRMALRWDLAHIPGLYPPCWFLPEDAQELWGFSDAVRNAVYIWKPAGAWGGAGIEMTRNIPNLLKRARIAQFERLENTQCYGLQKLGGRTAGHGGLMTEAVCRDACEHRTLSAKYALDESGGDGGNAENDGAEDLSADLVFDCEVWNFNRDDGCWVSAVSEGTPCSPTGARPGWIGGKLAVLTFDADSGPESSESDGTDSSPTVSENIQSGEETEVINLPANLPSSLSSALHASASTSVVQYYISDPVVGEIPNIRPIPGGDVIKTSTIVKTDIRIQGFAFLDPFRVYVSRHGYYRSGSIKSNYTTSDFDLFNEKLMHVTHHIPKVEKGEFVFGESGGSLEKWLKWVRELNGLEPDVVWKNVKLTLGAFLLGARYEICEKKDGMIGSQENTVAVERTESDTHSESDNANRSVDDTCRRHGFHFIADMIVDSSGRAWVMEVHFTLGVKSPGLGDPEAGFDELLTRETRQGVYGAISMSFARFMDLGYRREVEKHFLLNGSGSSKDTKDMTEERQKQQDLLDLLMEERMLCRMDTESIFPGMWREIAGPEFEKKKSRSPVPLGLVKFYTAFEQDRERIEGLKQSKKLTDDRKTCHVFDFNKDRVWQKEHVDFF